MVTVIFAVWATVSITITNLTGPVLWKVLLTQLLVYVPAALCTARGAPVLPPLSLPQPTRETAATTTRKQPNQR
jgi:hypothetical protein